MIKAIIFFGLLAAALGAKIPCEPTKEEYIVGGNETKIEKVPYQVALYYRGRFICGGSIVSPTHVVTAAHCVAGADSGFTIRAGTSNRYFGGISIPARNIVYHPKFSMEEIDYDAAVIELQNALTFNSSIKAIKIADKEPADGAPVLVSGWGCLKENGTAPALLQSVIVPMVKRKTCEKNYEKYIKITPRMICAGVEGKDACQGDSGGPLVYNGALAGIVSTGVGCARKDFPGIYGNPVDPEIRAFIKKHANV